MFDAVPMDRAFFSGEIFDDSDADPVADIALSVGPEENWDIAWSKCVLVHI